MTISVVLATYNGAEFLREQLDSVLAQTLLPNEIIVSDDNSTDDTWQILEEYKANYPNLFRIYQNENRLGAHRNFKHAFKYVTCDLVAPCDQDDIWLPEKLERCVAALQYNDISFVFCQEMIQYENSKQSPVIHMMPSLHECIFGRVIPGHLIVCRRDMLKVFDLDNFITFDLGLTVYAAIKHTGIAIDYVGCIWRRHSQVVTTEWTIGQNKIIIEKISTWKKWWRTLRSLSMDDYSEVIARRMRSFSVIISKSVSYKKGGGYERKCHHISTNMERQTTASILKAGIYNMWITMSTSQFRIATIRTKLGMLLYAFRYPAVYWYDYHNHEAL